MSVSQSTAIARPSQFLSTILRLIGAMVLTGLLVVFLVLARGFSIAPKPDEVIREMATLPPVALPAPEQVTSEDSESATPPPPQKIPELPRLEFQVEQIAPPVRAVVNQQSVDFAMQEFEFELEAEPVIPIRKPAPSKKVATYSSPKKTSRSSVPKPAPARTTYSASELDGKPRLLNRPGAAYPQAMLRKGIRSGRVLLEVSISPSGRCTVRRVISSTHPDFSKMARSFASSARFSAPKKNGRAVTAIYKWPLVLKP